MFYNMNLCFFRIQKTEAQNLFDPAWLYAEVEEAYWLLKKYLLGKDLQKIKEVL